MEDIKVKLRENGMGLDEIKERHSYYPELNNKDWITQKYCIEQLSSGQIAKIIGCRIETVRNNLIRFKREIIEFYK